jgi:hypothetical protein
MGGLLSDIGHAASAGWHEIKKGASAASHAVESEVKKVGHGVKTVLDEGGEGLDAMGKDIEQGAHVVQKEVGQGAQLVEHLNNEAVDSFEHSALGKTAVGRFLGSLDKTSVDFSAGIVEGGSSIVTGVAGLAGMGLRVSGAVDRASVDSEYRNQLGHSLEDTVSHVAEHPGQLVDGIWKRIKTSWHKDGAANFLGQATGVVAGTVLTAGIGGAGVAGDAAEGASVVGDAVDAADALETGSQAGDLTSGASDILTNSPADLAGDSHESALATADARTPSGDGPVEPASGGDAEWRPFTRNDGVTVMTRRVRGDDGLGDWTEIRQGNDTSQWRQLDDPDARAFWTQKRSGPGAEIRSEREYIDEDGTHVHESKYGQNHLRQYGDFDSMVYDAKAAGTTTFYTTGGNGEAIPINIHGNVTPQQLEHLSSVIQNAPAVARSTFHDISIVDRIGEHLDANGSVITEIPAEASAHGIVVTRQLVETPAELQPILFHEAGHVLDFSQGTCPQPTPCSGADRST